MKAATVSQTVRELAPTTLWNHFSDLNAVPRPSKKEGRVIEFMRQFGHSLGLETVVDQSAIVKLMSSLYVEMFGEEADVCACHAGLECGILGRNYPDMQMISFGPNIHGAHSPDERVQISSVQKYWGFLLETLKRIPGE